MALCTVMNETWCEVVNKNFNDGANIYAHFLFIAVEPFKKDHISLGIIQRLLKTSVVFVKAPKLRRDERQPVFTYLYEKVSFLCTPKYRLSSLKQVTTEATMVIFRGSRLHISP